jgi:site-specific DNA recombinase
VDITGSNGERSHVGRAIEPTEAEIVRTIFRLCAEGHGVKGIAKRLNDLGAPSPRAQQGRSQTWAPTSVRAVLYRPLYRGEIIWNRTQKRDRWGRKHQTAQPEGT